MNIIALDLGTYSLKVIEGIIDKKKLQVLGTTEYCIADFISHHDPQNKLNPALFAALKEYLLEKKIEGKSIIQIPGHLITTRYLNFPVKNRKKVEQLIPFQLDENLPFSAAKAHYVYDFEVYKDSSDVIVSISNLNQFNSFYSELQQTAYSPDIITSEVSSFHHLVKRMAFDGHYMILDIGHNTTKAYMISNRKVVANHISHTSGKTIDEVISHTYEIDLEQAIDYKHENAFFLTEGQYEYVDEKQRDFGLLMKRTFDPLLSEIKRWEIGHRVSYGHSPEYIFLTGGTSNLKNIDNFLTQYIGIKTKYLHTMLESQYITQFQDIKLLNSFIGPVIMADNIAKKSPSVNFKKGAFASGENEDIPLHSAAFIGVRSVMFMLLFLGAFFLERFIISSQIKKMDHQIAATFANPLLGISKSDQRSYRRNPERVLNSLKREQKQIRQEISLIQSSSRINSLSGLTPLVKVIGDPQVINLTQFRENDLEVNGIIQSDDPKKLRNVAEQLRAQNFPGLTIEEQNITTTITFKFYKD